MRQPSLLGSIRFYATRKQAYTRAVSVLATGLFLGALGVWLHFLLAGYPADVGGDAYTYARFGRLLGSGQITIENSVADVFRNHMEPPGTPQPLTWNTAMLPSGAWVYTVAPGFPLVLAAAYQIGGLGALMHANLLFQAGVALLFFAFLLISNDRPTRWLCALAGTCGFFLLDPQTQHQFISLWREPLLFLLFLGSACALVLQDRYPRCYWAIPFLLGYATAVKESSLLYAALLGGVLLSSPAFRAHPRVWRRVLLGGAVFMVASAPLWLQNFYLTGRPWLSLYVARETAEYSVTDAGMGLSAGNVFHTVGRYIGLYRPHAHWLIPFIFLALLGLYRQRHTLAGRLMVAWLIGHVALYIQWGNAEARHMYFVVFPLLFGVVHGMDGLLQRFTRYFLRGYPLVSATVWVAVAAMNAVSLPARHRPFQVAYGFGDWRAVAESVQQSVPDEALVLSNRWLRDIIGGYTSLGVTRLRTLQEGTGIPAARIIREEVESGRVVYFLDNPDQSPRSTRLRTDLSLIDRKILEEQHDLVPVRRMESDDPFFVARVGRSFFTIYRVEAWQSPIFERTWDVEPQQVAFLFLSPRRQQGELQLWVNDEPLDHDFDDGPFIPLTVSGQDTDKTALRVEGAQTQMIPHFSDATWMGWEDPIKLPAGDTAIPDDQYWFPDGVGEQPFADRRLFDNSFQLRLPVREGDDFFTAIALHLKGPRIFPLSIAVDRPPSTGYAYTAHRGPVWIPVPALEDAAGRRAIMREITVHVPEEHTLHVAQMSSHVIGRSMPIPDQDPGMGWLFTGYIMPVETAGNWYVTVGEQRWKQGQAAPVPHENPTALFLGAHELENKSGRALRWHEAGLLQPGLFAVGQEFALTPDSPLMPFLTESLHQLERDTQFFRWTSSEAVFRLPVIDAAATYRLELMLACHAPEEHQTVDIWVNDELVDRQRLDPSTATLTYDIPAAGFPEARWMKVTLRMPGWRPAAYGSADRRKLGVRWYGLTWTHLEPPLRD